MRIIRQPANRIPGICGSPHAPFRLHGIAYDQVLVRSVVYNPPSTIPLYDTGMRGQAPYLVRMLHAVRRLVADFRAEFSQYIQGAAI